MLEHIVLKSVQPRAIHRIVKRTLVCSLSFRCSVLVRYDTDVGRWLVQLGKLHGSFVWSGLTINSLTKSSTSMLLTSPFTCHIIFAGRTLTPIYLIALFHSWLKTHLLHKSFPPQTAFCPPNFETPAGFSVLNNFLFPLFFILFSHYGSML